MSIPISQFIPPLFFLLVSIQLFSISVSIFALQISSSIPLFQVPHICVNIQYLFFFLTYFSQYDSLCPPMSLQMARVHSILWLIFHCIYAPLLSYPVLYQTFRLLACPGYCRQCCTEHWGTYTFLNDSFLWVMCVILNGDKFHGEKF